MKYCIIYSVKNDPVHLYRLQQSLQLFKENLNPFIGNVDIIFFPDDGLEKYLIDLTKNIGISNIYFQKFPNEIPKYSDEIMVKINESINNATHHSEKVGYKHMCRFWAGEIFKNQMIKEYDFFLRLDCDSFILEKVKYNIFEEFEKDKKICAYMKGSKSMDNPKMSFGLNNEIFRFEEKYEGKIIDSIKTIPEGTLVGTNFELCNIKSILNSDYMKVYEHIDKSGGIYIHRWGDHIIRYAIVSMIFGKNCIKYIDNIVYRHNNELFNRA